MNETWREIRLPADLCRAAEEKFRKQFPNVEELISFVLRTVVSDKAAEMDESDAHIIEERLRSLGYL